jgi:heme-degrading monooxygenase HmoA
MIVMFSARRLKPGGWEQFRRAWDPGDARPPGLQRIYHARNIRDEDEIISFGLFDMTEDEYRSWRSEWDMQEMQRVDHLSAFVIAGDEGSRHASLQRERRRSSGQLVGR